MVIFQKLLSSTGDHKILENSLKAVQVLSSRGKITHRKVKKYPKRYVTNVPVQSKLESLSAKGFLRNIEPYDPPKNALDTLQKLFREITGTDDRKHVVDIKQKFQLLSALNGEFSYLVPNSRLHTMVTLGDIETYYLAPVENLTPYDKLKNVDLPRNLHIMYDYHRFHPDTDTMFGGISALPKRSNVSTSLRFKDKYKGFDAGNPYTDI